MGWGWVAHLIAIVLPMTDPPRRNAHCGKSTIGATDSHGMGNAIGGIGRARLRIEDVGYVD